MQDNQKFYTVDHEESQVNAIVSFPEGQTFKIGVLLDKVNSFFRMLTLSKLSNSLAEDGLGTLYITDNKSGKYTKYAWNQEGVKAEILEPKSDGWKKGKVRMRVVLEFCPDEPEDTIDADNLNSNSLDEIRKTIS